MFSSDLYDTMLDNDEMWYIYALGAALIISDCSLYDN